MTEQEARTDLTQDDHICIEDEKEFSGLLEEE